MEFVILDQTTAKKVTLGKKGEYNPKTEYVQKACSLLLSNKITQMSGFTLTFKRKFHTDDPLWLHRHIEGLIIKSKIWNTKSYMLFPEFTKKGALHYHGIMWNEYNVEVVRSINWWRRKFGFVKPELEIRNIDNYIRYITKSYSKTGLWTIMNLALKTPKRDT